MSHFGLQAALALMWVPLYLFLAAYTAVFTIRDRARYGLYFSLLWLLMAGYALGCAGLYASDSPATGVGWQRIQMLSVAFAFSTLFLFTASFAGYRLRLWAVSTLYGISTIFGLSIFFSDWFFTSLPAEKEFELWGLLVRYPEMKPGWLGELCFAYGMVLLVAAAGMGVKAALKRKRGAISFTIALGVLVICAVNDILIALGKYRGFYLIEHGFAVMAATSAFFMLDRFLVASSDLARRTDELTRANRDLQSLDTMKEDLLANISHELRTPLVSIRGYAEIMLEGKLGPVTDEQANGLRVALRNVARLLNLIGNLLDYAKIRDGRVKLKRVVHDLRDVLRESLDAAAPQIAAAGLTLERALPADDRLLVRGDAGKLRQVFDNLLNNAIKFTRPGGEIRVTAERAPEGWIRAAVEDTGIGIPAAERDRIFERFYQVGGAPPDEPALSSAGVGLAIVREIVRLHVGDVVVTSREGEGSRFEIRLPRAARTEELQTPRERTPEPADAPRHLLLVDDDREIVEFLSLALSGEGYAVQVAKDGPTALELIRHDRFDLLLLDLTMSGMDGVEVLSRLRAEPGTEDLPVVIVTAHGGDDVRLRCLSAGANDFLLKPVAVDDLRRVVSRVLTEHR